MKNQDRTALFTIDDFVERLSKEGIDIKISDSEEEKGKIELQLLKYDEILLRIIKKHSKGSRINKFLFTAHGRKKLCWFDAEVGRIVIDFFHPLDVPGLEIALQSVGRIAKDFLQRAGG